MLLDSIPDLLNPIFSSVFHITFKHSHSPFDVLFTIAVIINALTSAVIIATIIPINSFAANGATKVGKYAVPLTSNNPRTRPAIAAENIAPPEIKLRSNILRGTWWSCYWIDHQVPRKILLLQKSICWKT